MKHTAWRQWLAKLENTSYALYLAARDPRVPKPAKFIVGLIVAYALSPIDVIPDFIPLLGYLDDLLLLPLALWLAVRLVPREVWQECLQQAEQLTSAQLPVSHRRLWLHIVVGFVWLCVLIAVGWLGYRFFSHADSQ